MENDKDKMEEKDKQPGFFKEILIEIGDTIIFEVIWNILMAIPKLMIRLIKNLW